MALQINFEDYGINFAIKIAVTVKVGLVNR
jgi:hypothetical protein